MARVHTTPFNETDCIGDCYEPINNSLDNLDTAVQDLDTEVQSVSGNVTELLGGIHNIMNIRMSLSDTTAITTTDIKNATNLYIHPYNGEVVSLWSTTRSRWELKQFSSIISIEGIYIISLSIDGIRQLKNGKFPFLNNLENSYEYPMSERYYDWNKYSTDTTIQVDTVKNEVEKYLNWFNKVNASFDNYFQIIFMPWNKLDEKTIFQIYYYNGNRLNINQMDNSTGVYPEVNLRKTVPPQPTRDNVTTTGRITNLPQPYTTKMY